MSVSPAFGVFLVFCNFLNWFNQFLLFVSNSLQAGGDREYKNISVKAPVLPPKPATNGAGGDNTYSYEYRREYNYAVKDSDL